jgi:hypothetical protein
MLWLSDINIDIDYLVGASSDCNKIACCHTNDSIDARSTSTAKTYGDLNCHMP